MTHSSPSSALIIDEGQRVLLRLHGQLFELSQPELRSLLRLPEGLLGLGISIDGDRFCFEFSTDDQAVELSTRQLLRRLAKRGRKPAEHGAGF